MGLKDACQPQLPRNRNQHEPSYLFRMEGHTICLQEPAAKAELPGSMFYSGEDLLERGEGTFSAEFTWSEWQKKWTCR